jgi:hypothetical protein
MDIALIYSYFLAVVILMLKLMLRFNEHLQYRNGVYLKTDPTTAGMLKLMVMCDMLPIITIVASVAIAPIVVKYIMLALLSFYCFLLFTPSYGNSLIKDRLLDLVIKLLLLTVLIVFFHWFLETLGS